MPQYGEWWRWTVAKTNDARGFVTPGTEPFIWRLKPDESKIREWFLLKIQAGELENCDGAMIDGFYYEPGLETKKRIPVPGWIERTEPAEFTED